MHVSAVVRCSSLKSPLNGRVKLSREPVYGTVAIYTCRAGFGLMGDSTRTCQADGSWSGSTPSCQSKQERCMLLLSFKLAFFIAEGSCGTLPDPENGLVRFTSIVLGGHATFICDQGYVREGDYVRTCGVDGTWSGASPTCQRKFQYI